jgi:hypothetical protein
VPKEHPWLGLVKPRRAEDRQKSPHLQAPSF